MKRTPWKRKPWKRKPISEQKPMKRSPMNRVGKQGRLNAAADKASKKELERSGIDYCQCCGRTFGVSRSHDYKRRYEDDLGSVTLLCTFPCHNFFEYKLTAEERATVNSFLRESDLDGEYKFNAMLDLLPPEKAKMLFEAVLDSRI